MYLTGVLLAAKLMDDNVFNNPYWAKVTLPARTEDSPDKLPASLAILRDMVWLLLRCLQNQVTLP